jgi:mRNA interferase RelE/StbE
MRIETITRNGKEFAVIPVEHLQKLMEDAGMLADVKAYDAAKARLANGEDELIPLEISERRLKGEAALRVGVSTGSSPRNGLRRKRGCRAR